MNQDFDRSNYEIIVVKNFTDDHIDYYLSSHGIVNIFSINNSIGMKFAEGMRLSKGDIICFLEDDDIFLKNKLSEVNDTFRRYPQLSYYHNNALFINEKDEIIENFSTFSSRKVRSLGDLYVKKDEKDKKVFKLFELGAHWNTSCISIKKIYFLSYVDGTLSKINTLFDAAIFFSALCSNGDIVISNKILSCYRKNQNSATQFAKFDHNAHSHISALNLNDNVILEEVVRGSIGSKSKTFERLMTDRMYWQLKRVIYSKSTNRKDGLKYLLYMVLKYKLYPSRIISNLLQLSGLFLFLISPKISRRSRIA